MKRRKRVVLVRLMYCGALWAAWLMFTLWPRAGDSGEEGVLLSAVFFLLVLLLTGRFLSALRPTKVPVLMYHSVAPDQPFLPWKEIILPVDLFEQQVSYLARNGFTTITLGELQRYRQNGGSLPPKPIVLTFDDGFLDNWVFAYPILKKYGLKGTLFVSTEFVGDTEEYRPNLEDVWNNARQRSHLDWRGYVSWRELGEMQRSGILDVQSHGTTHTWYFQGDEVIDFHHPKDDYVWLAWNEHPEQKLESLRDDCAKLTPWGIPVYRYDRSLLGRRFFDPLALRERLSAWVKDRGGESFFDRSSWRKELFRVVSDYAQQGGPLGQWETDEEYAARIRNEICGSKRELERKLGRKVDFFCWPGDRWTEALKEMALGEGGYLAVTADDGFNSQDDDFRAIGRVFVGRLFGDRGPRCLDLWFFKGLVSFSRGSFVWALFLFPLIVFRDLLRRVLSPSFFYPDTKGTGV
jgi:hypothetical protein